MAQILSEIEADIRAENVYSERHGDFSDQVSQRYGAWGDDDSRS